MPDTPATGALRTEAEKGTGNKATGALRTEVEKAAAGDATITPTIGSLAVSGVGSYPMDFGFPIPVEVDIE